MRFNAKQTVEDAGPYNYEYKKGTMQNIVPFVFCSVMPKSTSDKRAYFGKTENENYLKRKKAVGFQPLFN